MPSVVVKDSHLTFSGVAYFRSHAEDVQLGSIGEKRTPLTKQNYLEVKDHIPAAKIKGTVATITEIDFTQTSQSVFGSAVDVIIKGVPVQWKGDATFDSLRSGHLKLVKFTVENNEMMRAANDSPQMLDFLIGYGNDARIAHQIFVVMESSIATKFNNNVAVSLSAGTGGVEATVGGSSSTAGSTTVQLSKGTTFAYLLAKIDWDANLKKNKTKIVDLDDDQWSFS